MEIQRFPVISEGNFKDAHQNRWRTSIFILGRAGEATGEERGVYTLEEGRQVFLNSATEYEAAMQLVTSWDHWKAVRNSPMNRGYIEAWLEEKNLADQTKARKKLMAAAEEGNVGAARLIYEAKKEEAEQRRKEKAQKEIDKRGNDILTKSLGNIISIEAKSGHTT
tara:strand:- start:9902 stop:10399 length:498 start_codon:yes stop_codon:yes gene_type:complete